MLLPVEVEGGPAGAEVGPGRHRVAGDEKAPLGPVEREVPRRVSRGVQHDERPERITLVEQLVDRAWFVLRPAEEEPERERPQAQRLLRQQGHRLRPPVAPDDVRLPLVREHLRAARALQRGEPAEVRAVPVRDGDPLQVARVTAESFDRVEHEPRVTLEQGVDQRQLVAVLDQERVDVPALAVAEAMDAGRELFHGEPAAPARCQGANGFATPRSAGSSSGKWRRSSVRIELPSTQSIPSFV